MSLQLHWLSIIVSIQSSPTVSSSLPALQHQRCSLQESIEVFDLLQHATTDTLVADVSRDALEQELNSDFLHGTMAGIMWVLLFSAFDSEFNVVDCCVESILVLRVVLEGIPVLWGEIPYLCIFALLFVRDAYPVHA